MDKEYIGLLQFFHRVGFKSAIIAGGYVRDMFFKKDYKDIDIFLEHPSTSGEILEYTDEYGTIYRGDEVYSTLEVPGYTELQVANSNIMCYSNHNKIVSVLNMSSYSSGTDVQLIFIQDVKPIDYVNQHFDIGLCMCYFDGVKLRYTNAFLEDYFNKTLTICGNLSKDEFEHSVLYHLDRMKSKFPDYTVVVADHLIPFLTPKLRRCL